MTDPLFQWHVYLDHFPLAVPELIGEVSAPTLAVAKNLAAAEWPNRRLLVQSALSARVRPATALPLPHEVQPCQETRVPPTYRGRKAPSKPREPRRDEQLPLGMRPGDYARASHRAMTTNDRRQA